MTPVTKVISVVYSNETLEKNASGDHRWGLVYLALRQDGDASEQCDEVRLPSRLRLYEQGGQL
jgi:hypothetical protein